MTADLNDVGVSDDGPLLLLCFERINCELTPATHSPNTLTAERDQSLIGCDIIFFSWNDQPAVNFFFLKDCLNELFKSTITLVDRFLIIDNFSY